MSKKTGYILTAASAVALILAVISLFIALQPGQQPAQPEPAEDAVSLPGMDQPVRDVQYVMYLGTNGKDTNEPVFDHETARERAIEVLLRHFGGYTIQEANGGWVDGDTVYTEYTLVISLSDTSREAVHAAADELLQVFDQSSILIHTNETATEWYSGAAE